MAMTSLVPTPIEPGMGEPAELVWLADGGVVLIRAARPEDGERLRQMFYRLSLESAYFWAFLPVAGRARWADILASLAIADGTCQYAAVALAGGEVVGIARYDVAPGSQEAEIGIVIEDRWQARGLGKVLAHRLIRQANRQQISHFTARVLGENRRVLRLLVAVFASVTIEWESGEGLARLEEPK